MFLLNREEAHNALFREALNKVKDSGTPIFFTLEGINYY